MNVQGIKVTFVNTTAEDEQLAPGESEFLYYDGVWHPDRPLFGRDLKFMLAIHEAVRERDRKS